MESYLAAQLGAIMMYSGGCGVRWRAIISTVEGYHQYGRECGVRWRAIISTVEGCHQYGREYDAEYDGGLSSIFL